MKYFLDQCNPVQRATLIWLGLMLATVSAAVFSMFFSSGVLLLMVSVAILIFKGQMIVDHFMGLRDVARHWRMVMSAYCIVISLFVITAYLMGLST